jgi:hypothetical protein
VKNRTLVMAAFLLALIALVISASSSLGRSKPDPRASTSPYPQGLASATKKSGLKVRYLYADGTLQPGGFDGYQLKCPMKTPNPIGGFGGAVEDAGVGKVALLDSYPGPGKRNWSVGMRNLSDQPQKYYIGIVCAR